MCIIKKKERRRREKKKSSHKIYDGDIIAAAAAAAAYHAAATGYIIMALVCVLSVTWNRVLNFSRGYKIFRSIYSNQHCRIHNVLMETAAHQFTLILSSFLCDLIFTMHSDRINRLIRIIWTVFFYLLLLKHLKCPLDRSQIIVVWFCMLKYLNQINKKGKKEMASWLPVGISI